MKILIADDESHVIQAIRLLVPWEALGIDRVITALSGIEAARLIELEQPELVITDIVMEDKSGLELMELVASRCPGTKVIAVSGHNDFDYVRSMLTRGCLDYLLKPLEATALVAAVRRAVQSWQREHESALSHRRLLQQITGVLLGRLTLPGADESAWQELTRTDERFSHLQEACLIFYDRAYFPMEDAAFSSALLQLEKRLAAPAPGCWGVTLSLHSGQAGTSVLLCGLNEERGDAVLREAQSLFSGSSFPFFAGLGACRRLPADLPYAYEQARRRFLSFQGDVMLQIARYMEQNYRQPFIQTEYAQRFFLNKDYMSRKFTAAFGVGMLAYLNEIRIRHAKELLSDFTLKIQDIAYAVGFRDEKYFAKQFKRATGLTPGEYRLRLQELPQ